MQREFLVYITSDKKKNTFVKITEKDKFLHDMNEDSEIIHAETYFDLTKAVRRKNQLSQLTNEKRIELIKKKNPELLNLIFAITGD